MSQHEQLQFGERKQIERYLKQGRSLRYISRRLGRSPNTIRDEVVRNRVKGRYLAKKAQHKAYVRRKYSKYQGMKVAGHKELRNYVEESLRAHHAPDSIAGRLKYVDTHLPYVSKNTLYRYVFSPYGRQLEPLLHSRAVKKKKGPKKKLAGIWLDGRTSIEERPKHIETRLEFGHWELDFLESGQHGQGSLMVLQERKSRRFRLRKMGQRDTLSVNWAVAETLQPYAPLSVTTDNDLSLQKHHALSQRIKAPLFFCHTYSAWEKGGIENLNRWLRRYIPKGSDISKLSTVFLAEVEQRLNAKPRKILNYKTPLEVFEFEFEKQKNTPGQGCDIMERNGIEKLNFNYLKTL